MIIVTRILDSIRARQLVAARSPHWPTVRRVWLKDHPTCAACGTMLNAEVHHMKPFHLYPELELQPSNFITLCERPGSDCHLHFGHHDNWKLFNVNVIPDAAAELAKHTPTLI